MKKLISIILTLSLVLSLGATAFADTTVNNPTRTYVGYKLLDLTTSLKTGDTCASNNHTSDCYNYSYTVPTTYQTILQNEVFDNADDAFWATNGPKPTVSTKVTNEQIIKYLEAQDGDVVEGNVVTYGSLRNVADRIYRAIKTENISADETNMTGQNDNIAQGYWLIADVTELDAEAYAANSLVMLNTKGESNITVTPKTGIPTLEKKVKDINDSEDSNITDNKWQDSADHDINNVVPFKLTATLPNNIAGYDTYKLVFHDVMSAGLTLKADTIKVLMYNSKTDAESDIKLEKPAQTVTASFGKPNSAPADGKFTISCENIFGIDGVTVTKDTVFVVYYEATLNENAVIGAEGNPNEAYLEFSNNPYDEGTGKTNKDKVIVFTYQVTVNKTDSLGQPLKGAGFKLYKKAANTGEYELIGNELTGDDMTTFEWKGLDDGDYKLEESTVPAGYNKMSDIVFSISASHSETADEPELISLDGGLMGTGDKENGMLTGKIIKDIQNHTGTVLPETGAKGTMMLIMGGGLLVAFAAVFMITRKKMSIYEE